LKQTIQDDLFWNIATGFEIKSDIYFKYNQAEFQDNIIQLTGDKKFKFYQYSYRKDYFESEAGSGRAFSLFMRFDSFQDTYKRRVYSIADMFAQIGGVYECLFILGELLVSILAEKL
jgi:hypothetical protein